MKRSHSSHRPHRSLLALALFSTASFGATAALTGCPKANVDGTGPTPSASGAETVIPVETDGGGGRGGRKEHPRKDNKDKEKTDAKEKEVKETDAAAPPTGGDAAAPPMKIAINKPTPEPMHAPPLRKPTSIPTLPVFPAKDKYPKEPKFPGPKEEGNCGQVWTGTEYIGVDCVAADIHTKHPRMAKVVVPYMRLRQPVDKLPKMVDHRFDGTEGIVRAQGGNECTAFAFTSALDHAYARWTGTPGEFSVMQVWARYHKLSEAAAAATNVGDLLAPETEWPYDKALAASWTDCDKDPKKRKGPCGKPVEEDKLKALDKHGLAEITQIEVIEHPELELLREKLAAGQDATVGLKLHSFGTAGDAGSKYILGQPPEKAGALHTHEVVIAGYATTPTGTYYLVHNSWGTRWGDQGYAWMHEDILKGAWITGSMEIPDVEPMQVMQRRARAHGKLGERCEAGKVPDSVSGLCAGKCPDGGPRHNNICPEEKKECPAGHINLTGECVLSAPKSAGAEGKIKWECAPSGCVYEMSKGELDCKEKECQVSCPAPDFRLATTPKGLVCVE